MTFEHGVGGHLHLITLAFIEDSCWRGRREASAMPAWYKSFKIPSMKSLINNPWLFCEVGSLSVQQGYVNYEASHAPGN